MHINPYDDLNVYKWTEGQKESPWNQDQDKG